MNTQQEPQDYEKKVTEDLNLLPLNLTTEPEIPIKIYSKHKKDNHIKI